MHPRSCFLLVKESFHIITDTEERFACGTTEGTLRPAASRHGNKPRELSHAKFLMEKVIVPVLAWMQHIWHYETFTMILFSSAFGGDIPHC